MKFTFLILTCLFLNIYTQAQTVLSNTSSPKIEFTEWINNPEGITITEDKPIVLEFWATWCKPCIEAIPHVNNLTKKYKDDITFISVNSFEDRSKVDAFLLKQSMLNYIALDEDKTLMNSFKVGTIPVTILIDKNKMMRWKGITTQLTDEILETFLEKDTIYDVYNEGIIHQQTYSLNILDTINYELIIEYGDNTKGKSIMTDYEDRFFVQLGNRDIYSMLTNFADWYRLGYDWEFNIDASDRTRILNITVKSDVEIQNEDDQKKIIEDVILRLAETLDFTITTREQATDIWYITMDELRLKDYLSVNQDVDTKVVERTDKYVKYQNIFFAYMASSFSISTKEKVEYISSSYRYDLTIPKTRDILELKTYLKKTYGIDLVKKNVMVKVNTAIFN